MENENNSSDDFLFDDLFFFNEAISEAQKAFDKNEVPIGCVIVYENKIIAKGHNLRNTKGNSLYHAEIIAINKACEVLGDWRLEGCTLFVTIEPCPMCAGAIVTSRIDRVVFGARNKKAGCAGSILDILNEERFNHQVEYSQIKGELLDKSGSLMSEFFKKRRV